MSVYQDTISVRIERKFTPRPPTYGHFETIGQGVPSKNDQVRFLLYQETDFILPEVNRRLKQVLNVL